MAIDVMNLISWPSENKLFFFSLAAPELWLCGPAISNHSRTGKILKEYGSFSPLRSWHEKIQVPVDPVRLCETDATENALS